MKDVLFFISTAAVIFVGFKLSEEEAIVNLIDWLYLCQ